MELITERYANQINGVLNCYDRILLSGTIPTVCYAEGMTGYLYGNNIRIFDYPDFAKKMKEEVIRKTIEDYASLTNTIIEFVSNSKLRKEELVQQKILKRGEHPGIVHILSAMELCTSYRPFYDELTKRSFLKFSTSKCLHYYVYFIDEDYGLCHLRIPTWLPCRLQFCFNGHSYLARQMDKEGIIYKQLDNSFSDISDWDKAQELADKMDIKDLHRRLDDYVNLLCPVAARFNQSYHWSIMQAEYATDICFTRQKVLQEFYSELVSTAIHTVKPDNIATFLGKKKLDLRYKGEVGNKYNIRIEGSRIRHQMGNQSIKMYDKFSQILRIETTTSDVSFFKHYRKVEHRNKPPTKKFASMKKNIYSLTPLRSILLSSNHRYLEFISAIDDKRMGKKRLQKVTKKAKQNNRNYRGLNFFSIDDQNLLLTLIRGEFNIYGFRNKDLRKYVSKTSSQVSRLFKNLRVHGLIKKAHKSHKYYLTRLGKEVILTGQKIIEAIIIPSLNYSYSYYSPKRE